MKPRKPQPNFVLCIRNDGCDDLEPRKVYQVLEDPSAREEGYRKVLRRHRAAESRCKGLSRARLMIRGSSGAQPAPALLRDGDRPSRPRLSVLGPSGLLTAIPSSARARSSLGSSFLASVRSRPLPWRSSLSLMASSMARLRLLNGPPLTLRSISFRRSLSSVIVIIPTEAGGRNCIAW